MPRKRNRDKQMTGEEGEIKVLAAVAVDPQISSRAIAQGSGMCQVSVLRILHCNKFHPYHISLHEMLHGNAFEKPFKFCTWSLRRDLQICHIYFNDETTFTNQCQVNL